MVIIMISSHNLIRTTYHMTLQRHSRRTWADCILGRYHRTQIQLPSLNTHETGARQWVRLQVTIFFHPPFSMLSCFNSWLWSAKGRKKVVGDQLMCLVLTAFQTTFKSFSLICKTSFWDIRTGTTSPLKRRKRRRVACHLQKRKKPKPKPNLNHLVGIDWGYGDFGMNHVSQFHLHAWLRYFSYLAVLELSMCQKSVHR